MVKRKVAVVALVVALSGCAVVPPNVATPSPTPSPSIEVSEIVVTPTEIPSPAVEPTQEHKASLDVAPGSELAGMVLNEGANEVPSRGGATLGPTKQGPLSGRTIVVDPGHQGQNPPAVNSKQVPAGGGKTKPCQASGTSSVDGYPEHKLTWAVGVKVVGLLRANGATVILTRANDTGSGPCVDERAAIVNRAKADLLLSIHGDGANGATQRGFHVIVSGASAGGAGLQARSMALARSFVAAYESRTGLPSSNYVGGGTGIHVRTDIAGVNLLQTTPGIMVEMGNLRNATDWNQLKQESVQQKIAESYLSAALDILR